ncbi:hypothetical protein DCAR_0934169 [Daucus carota subsp. sativus]|uniref:NB-ARC domain-containing protein n=1 Tax=Daucus carota subsp. sativus TaxID=79200 RepID=A0AAF0XXE4_DAUCS|nr:hypothetical protein DCAR_0934169 [Daucus carota subsp. sativus]
MSSRIAEIKSRWDDRSTTGANFIGFYGMGGVGKTTTANAFYDLIRGDSFEGQYVLENIGERSRKGSSGLLELQERLLSSILDINNLRLDSLSMGTAWMSKKISTKKVLLIFDDIDKPDQVRALVGERSWFGPGSTVMITTRDKGLLQMIPVDVEYEIKLMEVSESEELFSRHAFEGDPAPEPHKKLLHDIVHYCGGLPLALQILGSHLFNKPLKEWKRTLDKVRLVPMFEIQDKLRISYDGLDVDEKTIFLDIACLFIGDGTESVQCIIHASYHEERTFRTEAFEKMQYLRLLRLYNVNLKGSFQHIFTGLKSLCWQKCPLNCLPSTFEPQNLVVLDLRDSKELITVWEDILSLPALLPPTLESLNARNCISLEKLPNLGHLQRMTELILVNCSSLNDVIGLGGLLDIEDLNFSGCTGLETLIVLPPNLKRLDVDGCKRLLSLPDILPTNLKHIFARRCESLEKVQNMKHLQSMIDSIFKNCSRLDDILSVDNLFWLSLISYQGCINMARADHTLQSLIMV